ncbi:hypothetical protein AQF98_09440 [Pedobacter sp. Hv1]|nr:hypothetical protein AQF98_09440 [Pedobacter sp. Hv1]
MIMANTYFKSAGHLLKVIGIMIKPQIVGKRKNESRFETVFCLTFLFRLRKTVKKLKDKAIEIKVHTNSVK